MIPDNLRCEVCAEHPAEFVLVRRRGEDTDRTFVCAKCAGERTRLCAGAGLDLEQVLAGAQKNVWPGKATPFACRLCGTTLAEIVADGRPGCCLCYLRFASELEQRIVAQQGRARHVGKAPAQ